MILCIYLCICLSILSGTLFIFLLFLKWRHFGSEQAFLVSVSAVSLLIWRVRIMKRSCRWCSVKEVVRSLCVYFSCRPHRGIHLLLFNFVCCKAEYDNKYWWPECCQALQCNSVKVNITAFSLLSLSLFALNVVWYMYSRLLTYCWNVCSFDKKCNLYFG